MRHRHPVTLGLLVLVHCTPTKPSAPIVTPSPPIATTAAGSTSPCPAGMALIPAGSFAFGDASSTATVASYCLDLTEVTVGAYRPCVDAKTCAEPTPHSKTEEGLYCNWNNQSRNTHPVNCVAWWHAKDYCAWAGKRLPTEQEWEWAARGGDRGEAYPWGAAAPDGTQANGCGPACVANYRAHGDDRDGPMYTRDDGWPETAPVGSFPRGDNPWGVHDLAGNVVEWTESTFDPTDAEAEAYRVLRGGYWGSREARAFAASERSAESPGRVRDAFGFRCAVTPDRPR
jgi:formylglycine-generating enzyme required for sulfatase activity